MKRRSHVLFLGSFTGLLVVAACSGKRTPTGPPGPGAAPGNYMSRALRARMPADFIVPTTAETTASLALTMSLDGREIGAAAFLVGGAFVHAGDLDVRAGAAAPTALDTVYFPVGGVPTTIYTTLEANPDGFTLPFDGVAEHVFTGTGHPGTFPAFTENVLSTTAPVVNQPVPHNFYSKATDLVVSWTNPGTDTTIYVTAAIRMNEPADTTVRVTTATTRDVNGQLTIGSDRLQLLPLSGFATLVVSRYRLVYRTVSGGVRIGLVCESAVRIPLHLS